MLPTGSYLLSYLRWGGGERKKKSSSYMSGCPFSAPRTLSCPQISPDNIAWLHLPERGDSRWAEWLTKLNGSLFKSEWTHTHTHAHTLPHALTLFTLPRYSSPSLHRANTSSPSLTPPILRRRHREGRGEESERGSCEMEIRFIRWILCCHCWQRGLWTGWLSDREATVQRG